MLLKLWWCSALSVALLIVPGLLPLDEQAMASPLLVSADQVDRSRIDPLDRQPATRQGRFTANASILQAISSSEVVYLAETHDDPADHMAQLEIIQALAAQSDVAIALEMFQRPFQPVLDAYLASSISEAALKSESEYETRWGFDWAFYAPILQYAKAHQIPLIALNAPTEVTRKVASEGLESLTDEDFTYIPAIVQVDLSNEDYARSLRAVFTAHGGAGHSADFDNFFAAQVLWDETMAEGIAVQLMAQPERQVIVLVGEGHVVNDYGIPSRVARRLPNVVHASIRLAAPGEEVVAEETDFVWLTGIN